MTTTEKTCFKCGKTLPLDAFYKHSQMGDGHLNKCKECTKKDAHERRFGKNREKILAYDRARGSRQTADDVRSYRAANSEKWAAHIAVSNAVKKGILVKTPCVCCGEQRVEGHHPDYSRPLDVVWLCAACHRQLHASARKAA